MGHAHGVFNGLPGECFRHAVEITHRHVNTVHVHTLQHLVQFGDIRLIEFFIPVDLEDPVTGRQINGSVAGRGKIVVPGAERGFGTELLLRDLDRLVRAAGINDANLIDRINDALKAASNMKLLILDNQACTDSRATFHGRGRMVDGRVINPLSSM